MAVCVRSCVCILQIIENEIYSSSNISDMSREAFLSIKTFPEAQNWNLKTLKIFASDKNPTRIGRKAFLSPGDLSDMSGWSFQAMKTFPQTQNCNLETLKIFQNDRMPTSNAVFFQGSKA